ncbi:spore germination protein [Eubacteriales bacterium OttesenSCG-928-K08]|nr:spore germination protein [Eubacteriales bacterium OttesenSCG-928-K08]
MNLKQGRIGYQEALSVVTIASVVSAVFTTDSEKLYAKGNSAWLSMLISAFIALIVFELVVYAMRVSKTQSLYAFLCYGLGKQLAAAVALLVSGMLLCCAVSLLARFTLMVGRFVFPQAGEKTILLYFMLAVLVLVYLGWEGVARTARLFLWLLVAALVGALALASYGYELHRLAPFLGDGFSSMLQNAASEVLLFLPAMVGMLIVTRGVHGMKTAGRTGYMAGLIGGIIAALCQFCVGMTYSYQDLAQMHSPMFRLTMGFKSAGYFPRLDTLLLFGWVMSAVLAACYYVYTASLMYANVFAQEDIRPNLAAFTALAGGLALLSHSGVAWLKAALDFIGRQGYALLAAPLVLCAALTIFRAKTADKNDKNKSEPSKEEEKEA